MTTQAQIQKLTFHITNLKNGLKRNQSLILSGRPLTRAEFRKLEDDSARMEMSLLRQERELASLA
jgi:hypothetical protein